MSQEPIKIKDLIVQAGKQLAHEFEEIKKSNPHYGESGAEAEGILIEFLNKHMPKRFAAGTGIVIDDESNISQQTDVIIYDAENSPVYRSGPRTMILPNDNVASIIEVKSKLNKAELRDAAMKIASVKKLKRTPVNNADQPVTFSPLIMTKPLGIVFTYESSTSLKTLAENLKEINAEYPSSEWIDMIVVLDKGIISYGIQFPFDQSYTGNSGGAADDNFAIPPYYFQLMRNEDADLALNKFFLHLLSHLTFYRKRSSMNFDSLLGKEVESRMSIITDSYQYNLNRELVLVTDDHREGNFTIPIRYNIYSAKDKGYIGQVCWKNWQDGAIIFYSGSQLEHEVFACFPLLLGQNAHVMSGSKQGKLLTTTVVKLSEEEFINACENIVNIIPGILVRRDLDDNDPSSVLTYDVKERAK